MLEKITLLILFTALFLILAYLDKRFNLGLCQNSEQSTDKPSNKHFVNENKALKSRIEVLERIVTEPKYELEKEINKLRQSC